MGFFDVEIEQFEVYNLPLNEDPNTADLIGPALIAMQNNEDFAEHVKLTLVSILGRKDVHKFQNMIEDPGEVPFFEMPDSRMSILVDPTDEHRARVPAGAEPILVRVGGVQIIDWVNSWMFMNQPTYQPCPDMPTMMFDDEVEGFFLFNVIGVVFNQDATGYHVVLQSPPEGDNLDPIMVIHDEVTIPLAPEGSYDAVYYTFGEEDPTVPEEPPEEPSDPVLVDMCGLYLYSSMSNITFGEDGDVLITFPPIPIRKSGENYYLKYNEEEQHDIRRLAKVFEIDTKKLIDEIMEGEDIVGNEDKIDDIYVNLGVRIHDNSMASCRYIWKFMEQLYVYANWFGKGFKEPREGWQTIFGAGAYLGWGSVPNVFTIESGGDFLYEFGFTFIEEGTSSVGEILADPNLAAQYEDRVKLERAWYVSSSPGDGSAGEDYDQPPSAEEYLALLMAGEADFGYGVKIYECHPDGTVKTLEIFGFYGRMKVIDVQTGITRSVQLNPEDPNSILIPYIPAIGEQLTNSELGDCVCTSVHATIMVADIETKSLPWWAALIMVAVIVAVAWTGYGAVLAGTFAEFMIGMITKLIIGYIVGNIVMGVSKSLGWIGAIVGLVAQFAIAVYTGGQSFMTGLSSMYTSFLSLSLPQILLSIVNAITSMIRVSSTVGIQDASIALEESSEFYNYSMNEMAKERKAFEDESGGFVALEPLLDNLLETSIRSEVNPMDPESYFSMMDNFVNIGTDLLDVDRLIGDSVDIDSMMQPV